MKKIIILSMFIFSNTFAIFGVERSFYYSIEESKIQDSDKIREIHTKSVEIFFEDQDKLGSIKKGFFSESQYKENEVKIEESINDSLKKNSLFSVYIDFKFHGIKTKYDVDNIEKIINNFRCNNDIVNITEDNLNYDNSEQKQRCIDIIEKFYVYSSEEECEDLEEYDYN
jgi:hypothetical protein